MPWTLEWPRIGKQARVRLADHAAQQREVDDRPHVLDAVQVVRDAHRPAEDGVLRPAVEVGDLARSAGAIDARLLLDLVPRQRARRVRRTSSKPSVAAAMNGLIDGRALEQRPWRRPSSSAMSPPMCGCT